MPRGVPKRTQTGEKALNVGSVPGRRYGEGDDQAAFREAMPSPDRTGLPQAAEPQTPPGRPVTPGLPVDPAQVTQYLGSQNPNLLGRGTQRPDEPITAGMPTGPGPGPRPTQKSQLARTLQTLAAETGNPKWAELAQRAGLG